jgi:hypothetical protein
MVMDGWVPRVVEAAPFLHLRHGSWKDRGGVRGLVGPQAGDCLVGEDGADGEMLDAAVVLNFSFVSTGSRSRFESILDWMCYHLAFVTFDYVEHPKKCLIQFLTGRVAVMPSNDEAFGWIWWVGIDVRSRK